MVGNERKMQKQTNISRIILALGLMIAFVFVSAVHVAATSEIAEKLAGARRLQQYTSGQVFVPIFGGRVNCLFYKGKLLMVFDNRTNSESGWAARWDLALFKSCVKSGIKTIVLAEGKNWGSEKKLKETGVCYEITNCVRIVGEKRLRGTSQNGKFYLKDRLLARDMEQLSRRYNYTVVTENLKFGSIEGRAVCKNNRFDYFETRHKFNNQLSAVCFMTKNNIYVLRACIVNGKEVAFQMRSEEEITEQFFVYREKYKLDRFIGNRNIQEILKKDGSDIKKTLANLMKKDPEVYRVILQTISMSLNMEKEGVEYLTSLKKQYPIRYKFLSFLYLGSPIKRREWNPTWDWHPLVSRFSRPQKGDPVSMVRICSRKFPGFQKLKIPKI